MGTRQSKMHWMNFAMVQRIFKCVSKQVAAKAGLNQDMMHVYALQMDPVHRILNTQVQPLFSSYSRAPKGRIQTPLHSKKL